MIKFEDLVTDVKEARANGEKILEENGIENVDIGQQNVMLQFWQVEAVVYEIERLRELLTPNAKPQMEVSSGQLVVEVDKKLIPFNKNLKKDKE